MDIFEAAKKGDLEAVRGAIKRGEDVDQKAGNRQFTPLIEAASRGHNDVVKELLSAGATVDLSSKNKSTALQKAAQMGYLDVVKTLLLAGAMVDQANNEDETPLILAATFGQTDVFKELVSAGANFDQADMTKSTPLIWAAMNGHTEIVKYLLSLGADTDATDFEGKNALRSAKKSEASNPEVISLLTPPPEFVPVLPKGWEMFKDKQTKERAYTNKLKDITSSTPPLGYPLLEISTYPRVTFYDSPQELEFSSAGGYKDFDNGVEVTVPPNTVPQESTLKITVQPSFAPCHDFKLPNDLSSASPAYLISSECSASLNGGMITIALDHHVKVTTKEEAEDLVFLQADSTPTKRGVYKYEQIKEGKSEFLPGDNKGRLTFKLFPEPGSKFLKIGFRGGVNKGSEASNSSRMFRDDSPPPDSPPPDRNLYTVRVYQSSPQTSGAQLVIICISLYGQLYKKLLDVFEALIIPKEFPEVTFKTGNTFEQVQFEEKERAKLKINPVDGCTWTVNFDKKKTTKDDVDVPETGDYYGEDLLEYPEKLICRFSPEEVAPGTTTCLLSLVGMKPEINVQLQLNKSKVLETQLNN